MLNPSKKNPPDLSYTSKLLRQHPIQILNLATNYFWLLLIPLVRGLAALRFDFATWLSGAWFDVLILISILFLGFIRWHFIQFVINSDSIWLRSGIIIRREFSLPFKTVTSASADEPPLYRLIHASKLSLDTNCAITKDADLKLVVWRSCSDFIFQNLIALKAPAGFSNRFKCKAKWWILFSFIFSSTFSGIVLISTLIIQSSRIVGNYLEERILGLVNNVAVKITTILAIGLPPFAIAISLIVFIGWIISFVGNLMRYTGFSTARAGDSISIENGFLAKHSYYIDKNKVNYVDLRQNLLMKIFKLTSLQINCAGYGKQKNEIPVFLPIAHTKKAIDEMNFILPGLNVTPRTSRPNFSSFFRFFWLPLTFIVLVILIFIFVPYFFPMLSPILNPALFISSIPIIWFSIVKIVSFYTSGIFISDNSLFYKCKTSDSDSNIDNIPDKVLGLHYSFAFQFHSTLIPVKKITKIVIRQSIFQVPTATCSILVFTTNEFRKTHKIVSLPLADTVRSLRRFDFIPPFIPFFFQYKKFLRRINSIFHKTPTRKS